MHVVTKTQAVTTVSSATVVWSGTTGHVLEWKERQEVTGTVTLVE